MWQSRNARECLLTKTFKKLTNFHETWYERYVVIEKYVHPVRNIYL